MQGIICEFECCMVISWFKIMINLKYWWFLDYGHFWVLIIISFIDYGGLQYMTVLILMQRTFSQKSCRRGVLKIPNSLTVIILNESVFEWKCLILNSDSWSCL